MWGYGNAIFLAETLDNQIVITENTPQGRNIIATAVDQDYARRIVDALILTKPLPTPENKPLICYNLVEDFNPQDHEPSFY